MAPKKLPVNLDLIAEYYDLLYANLEDDLPMWQTFTAAVDGPILEVGCGTGRLLIPLALAGRTITGIDLSEVALSATRAKIEAAGLSQQASTQQADMRTFSLFQKKFALAFIPLNTFMHCYTIDDQIATLRTIHQHLRPEGSLIIDLFHPDPNLFAEADGRLYFEDEVTDELTDHAVQLYWHHQIDLAQQMRHLTYLLDEIDQSGLVRRTKIAFALRFIYRYEMELLLKAADFSLQTIYGDYSLEPFHNHSPKMIFVAQKAGA